MTTNPFLEIALWAVDVWAALVPRKKPSSQALKACKIISHRGEHDNKTVRENTMEAFDIAREAGAWGIETDIRWTADLVPMVHHDPDTSRVFGQSVTISQTEFQTLRRHVPEVPTLAELVSEFGGFTHLMIELKDEVFPQLEKQRQIFRDHLGGLAPETDYHFLALDTKMFDMFDIKPTSACLPVALNNIHAMSEAALEHGYGGVTGHFLLLTQKLREKHQSAGQGTGPGFIGSRNSLYREINRKADWIFTNDAVKLLGIIDNATKNRASKKRA